MRAVVQRVLEARVEVAGEVVAQMQGGLLVLLGVGHGDTSEQAEQLARKIVHLRIFEDEDGRMNRSLLEQGGTLCVVSQFTLYGDSKKGRRPSFGGAAPPVGWTIRRIATPRRREACSARRLRTSRPK